MKMLIWKEYREKRFWLILLAVSVAGVTAFRKPYAFLGLWNMQDFLWLPSTIVALLYGMTAYSSEIGWKTPDFLFSRPIFWKKLLAVKVGVAFAGMLAAALVGAAVLRLRVPDSHLDVLGTYWLQGFGVALIVMGLPYLVGLASSVLLPGFIGSVIVLTGVVALAASEELLLSQFEKQGSEWNIVVWLVAYLAAAIIVARFGLTLGVGRRVRPYVLTLAAGAAVSASLTWASPSFSWWTPKMSSYCFSPDGSYVLRFAATVDNSIPDKPRHMTTAALLRTSDGLGRTLTWRERVIDTWWMRDGTACGVDYSSSRDTERQAIVTARIDRDGALRETRFTPPETTRSLVFPSPDGTRVALLQYEKRTRSVRFVDMASKKTQDTQIRDFTKYWWQDNDTFGWIDRQGKRHLTKIE